MSDSRSVVTGGGLAGLVAAAAVAHQSTEVVILDRSTPPGGGGTHPHRAQLHNILTRGQRHLEELFPGFRTAFLEAGGAEGDVAQETHVHEFGGSATERSLGLSIWSAPWQTIWEVARALLPPNVQFRYGTVVDRITVHDHRVRGLRLSTATRLERVRADTVVDASGHSSSFPMLLRTSGVEAPRVERQRLDRWFVTIRLRRPTSMRGRPDFWLTFADPPGREAALISPHGPDEWLLSVSSQVPASSPPTGFVQVLDFLDELPGTPLRTIVGNAVPLDRAAPCWRRSRRWHHYEELEEPLRGFAPIGDAFASISPVYGQGVSVAAWQASALQTARSSGAGGASWSRAYVRAAGAIVAQAWALDAIPPANVPTSAWYDLLRSLADDPDLHRRYVGMWHLVEPPSSLPGLMEQATNRATMRCEGTT